MFEYEAVTTQEKKGGGVRNKFQAKSESGSRVEDEEVRDELVWDYEAWHKEVAAGRKTGAVRSSCTTCSPKLGELSLVRLVPPSVLPLSWGSAESSTGLLWVRNCEEPCDRFCF